MNVIRVLLIMAICVASAIKAEAGVAVTPERHIVLLSPAEESKTVEYQVYNSGSQDLEIGIQPEDWSGIKTKQEADINSWFKLGQDTLSIKAGETKPFKVTVSAPQGIDGELLAMIFLCYKEDKESMLNIRNGNPLYLVLKGTEWYGARIDSIYVSYRKSPVGNTRYLDIGVNVNNTSNLHIMPELKVIIKDDNKNTVKELILENSRMLLREEAYTFGFKWECPELAEGRYNVTAELNYEDKIKDLNKSAQFEFKDNVVKMVEAKPEK